MVRIFYDHRSESGGGGTRRITLHYTANIQGDLDMLPRLHTFLRQLRGDTPQRILLDMGDTCAPDVWHCQATGGRSVLIALDGMGYAAANTEGLTPGNRAKLESHVSMALVDAIRPHVQDDLLFALKPTEGDGHLCICLTPAHQTQLEGRLLTLAPVDTGHVGESVIEGIDGDYRLISAATYALPANTPPDATIAGVIDFIVSEARFFQRKQDQD